MIALILLYLLITFSSLSLWIASLSPRLPKLRSRRLLYSRLSGGLIATYLFCLAAVFYDPHWDDNGAIETIEFPFQFGWALIGAAFFQFIGVPIFIGVSVLISAAINKWKAKHLTTRFR